METVTWDVAVHTAYQARMGLGMAENHQTGTRPNDDAVVICRGMRQFVVKALTSAVGPGCAKTIFEARARNIDSRNCRRRQE